MTHSVLGKVTDWFLARLGLDLDLSIELAREPFNAIADDLLFLGARPKPELVPAGALGSYIPLRVDFA